MEARVGVSVVFVFRVLFALVPAGCAPAWMLNHQSGMGPAIPLFGPSKFQFQNQITPILGEIE